MPRVLGTLFATWAAASMMLPALAAGKVAVPASAAMVTVLRVPDGTVTLDGTLDEAAWRQAPMFALTQQDPHPGQPTPYLTTVRVLRDSTHLYFGVVCTDPDPANLAVHSLARDSDQTNDDHITIVLDTLGTHRLGYVFQVNAGGARTDGLISPASRDPNYDWGGIWNARVRRTATGWTAEIEIDTRSLQFRPGLDRWGLNIQRYVPRDQLSLQWTGISLDASIFDLSRMGTLAGVRGLEQGRGLEVSPYALVRHDSLGNRSAVQIGGDVRYQLTPGITATLTFNPDFAQAEADTQQVNLTRFSLFFPEQRRFFSDGSNIFAFGAGLVSNDTFIPYYSRRIGLVQGETVRVDSGLKVLGTSGPWTIGVLGVHMGRSDVSNPTDLFVGRLSYEVNPHLLIGTLLTQGDPTGTAHNSFAGMDAVWHTSKFQGDKNLTLSGWAARSSDPLPGNHAGWGVYAAYPNDLWSSYISINQFGDALDPALGFLPRPGTRQYDYYIDYRPRPTAAWLRWVRQFFYQLEVFQVDDLHGTTQTRRIFTAPFNVDTASDAHFEFDWIPDYEALSEPFEIAKGVTLPVGRYHFYRYHFEAQSSYALPWQIGNVMEIGSFYDGHLTQIQPFVNWTALGGKLSFQFQNETDFGYLREGNFIQRLYVLKVGYSFNPDLTVSTLAQYDSTIGHTGVNLRLHWIIAPGRDFFLVFNHGIEASVTDPNARVQPISNEVIAKLSWDFIQ
jgi:hypothetical protein